MLEELTFEGQKDGEKLIVFTRQHWYVTIGTVIVSFFAAFLPIVLIILSASFIVDHPGSSMVFMFFWMIYIMCIWFVLMYKIVFHILNIWIVTDSRILDIWQIGFFNRQVSELHLESIQDISVNTAGIVQSYFNFGNIDIQTAGISQHFTFEEVPNPLDIKDKIMDAANMYIQHSKKD
jgi:uncharacterized membrane protein YdbT with pleckstrin-like domain